MSLDEAVNRVKVLATALRIRAVELLHTEYNTAAEAEKDAEALELLAKIGADLQTETDYDRRHRRTNTKR